MLFYIVNFFFVAFNFRITNKLIFVDSIKFFIEWNTNIFIFRRDYQTFCEHITIYKVSAVFRSFFKIQSSKNSIIINSSKKSNFTANIIDVSKTTRFFNIFRTRRRSIITFNFFLLSIITLIVVFCWFKIVVVVFQRVKTKRILSSWIFFVTLL